MARRNPAFRIAIGGLTIGVVLCLVAAISLWKIPSQAQSTEPVAVADDLEDAPGSVPIQIAHEGETSGLLSDATRRLVPEPQDFAEQPTPDHLSAASRSTARVAQVEPTEPENEAEAETEPDATTLAPSTASLENTAAAPPVHHEPSPPAVTSNSTQNVEAEIASLKGQVNELARTQLENQLVEIRHAQQLLMTHQSTRMLEALQREVDQLKAEKLAAAQLAAEAAQSTRLTEPKTASIAEPPAQNSEPVVELGPIQDTLNTPDNSSTTPTDTHVRYSESAEMPGRYDVEADEATLQNFVAILGPVAGWNLVSGTELTGTVTLRWSRVDLRQALTQQLKAKGWQIREEGDFAIIESTSSSTARHVVAALPVHEETDESLRAPITLKLAPGSAEGSTYDKSTGILIQPGTSSRGVPVSRTRTLPPLPEKFPAQSPAHKVSKPAPAPVLEEPTSESESSPLLMKSAPLTAPIVERVTAAAPAMASKKIHPPEPLSLPLEEPIAAPAEMTPVSASPSDLAPPSAKIDIDVTIIELLTPQRPEQGILSQSITVTGQGPCPTCGQSHSSQDVPFGHAMGGWFHMNEGIRCGVCSMPPELIVTRLQKVSQATVTSNPHAQVLSRQIAEIGLTEKQGFRRINIHTHGDHDQYELLQGGIELAMRPTLEENGVIRLDLNPVANSTGNSSDSALRSPAMTSLSIPSGSCAVIGGMYFGIEQATDLASRSKRIGSILTGKFSERDIREIVVVVRVKPANESAIEASPASLNTESEASAPAPLLIPASASPIPQ